MNYFSNTYEEACALIESVAVKKNLNKLSVPINSDSSIHIYQTKNTSSNKFLITSGVHGVEGYLGSATQAKFIDEVTLRSDLDLAIVHIVNPTGMLQNRRFNLNNVDLNRNFWRVEPQLSPELYNKVSDLINPKSEKGLRNFKWKAFKNILRYGFKPLQQAIVQGQYHMPKGIFYGGTERQPESRCLDSFLGKFLTDCTILYGVDLHSGLGKYGKESLLLESEFDYKLVGELSTLIKKPIKQVKAAGKDNYQIQGGLIAGVGNHLKNEQIKMITLEIGIKSPITTLQLLCEENYYFNYDQLNQAAAGQKLKNHFFPNDPKWRNNALNNSVNTLINFYNNITI